MVSKKKNKQSLKAPLFKPTPEQYRDAQIKLPGLSFAWACKYLTACDSWLHFCLSVVEYYNCTSMWVDVVKKTRQALVEKERAFAEESVKACVQEVSEPTN